MEPVKVVQDDSGHWYVIPAELEDSFDEDLQDEDSDFGEKYGKYRTGGGPNLVQLFADLKNKQQ
jgi:hypothetical protein